MNKVLNNYNKSKRINGTSKGKIGTVLHLMDKNKERLSVGDTVRYGEYQGVLLYNHHYDQYGIALDYSMWYGDDKYNIDSYGKFIDIPMDNGARMEIEKLGWIFRFKTIFGGENNGMSYMVQETSNRRRISSF